MTSSSVSHAGVGWVSVKIILTSPGNRQGMLRGGICGDVTSFDPSKAFGSSAFRNPRFVAVDEYLLPGKSTRICRIKFRVGLLPHEPERKIATRHLLFFNVKV